MCDLTSPPRKERFEIQPLSAEQVQQFLLAVHGHKWETLFTMALATGMRQGELLGLKWQDITFSTGTLQVRRILSRVMSERLVREFVEADPKTEQSRRSIPLAPFALSALKQHRVRQLEANTQISMTMDIYAHVLPTMQLDAVLRLHDLLQEGIGGDEVEL